jgi:hypothetical protein
MTAFGWRRYLGKDAGGLSASTIERLKDAWSEEHTPLELPRRLRSLSTYCVAAQFRSIRPGTITCWAVARVMLAAASLCRRRQQKPLRNRERRALGFQKNNKGTLTTTRP